tara:strand:+ start:1580 stop:1771 length:192 start_codon:yes stop_codon:yes gene_type:complete
MILKQIKSKDTWFKILASSFLGFLQNVVSNTRHSELNFVDKYETREAIPRGGCPPEYEYEVLG